MSRSIAEAVGINAEKYPHRIAVADSENACTYEELQQMAIRTAQVLAGMDVKPGDVILAECTQKVGFLILDLACQWAGAVFVPFRQDFDQEQVKQLCAETQARYVIAQTAYEIESYMNLPMLLKQAGEMPKAERYEWQEKNGTAEILFTTGTTGKPKGIVISHRANIAIAENIRYGIKMSPETVEMVLMPLDHSHGLRTCYAALFNGSTVVILDGIRNVPLFFDMMEKYKVTALDLSPALAKLLLKIAYKGLEKYGKQLEYVQIGTAFLDDELKKKMREIFAGARLYNFYGSTEAGRSCVLEFSEADDTGCVGYPCENACFMITDEERRTIKSSAENPGLLAVSGKMMMDGYFGSEELTRTVLKEGILYTSDLGYMDQEGRVYVLGRKDDVINYKGIKIAPEEIETAAMQTEGILDCACVPVQDEIRGQAPKLYVVPSDGYDEKRTAAFLRKVLGAAKMPLYIETIDRIPRSANGKLLRKKLCKEKQKSV